nr:hypothetical protein [uncultured Sphaerochaeta sp.]
MKTKKHITLSLAVLLLLLALLSACNADASAGLFRQIADSQAPIGIVYRQLLGLETTGTKTLYYRTNEGIYKTDLSTRTQMKASVAGEIIQAAHYAGSDTVLYITNDSNEVKGTNNSTYSHTNAAIVTTNDRFVLKNLYANGMVMLKGDATSDSTKTQFVLTKYDNTSPLVFPVMDGYGLDSVLQLTGREDKSISTSDPIVISFVDIDGNYVHYYYDGTPLVQLTGLNSERLAAIFVVGTKLYLLTADGQLYGGPNGSAAMTSMYDGSKNYAKHAFFYGVTDGATTHLISKTNLKNEDLYVYSFPKDSTTSNVTTASIDEGYAEYLANADIVSALRIDTAGGADYVLVATNDNGLFKIEINHAFANINSIANGSSTKSEEYNFDLF